MLQGKVARDGVHERVHKEVDARSGYAENAVELLCIIIMHMHIRIPVVYAFAVRVPVRVRVCIRPRTRVWLCAYLESRMGWIPIAGDVVKGGDGRWGESENDVFGNIHPDHN